MDFFAGFLDTTDVYVRAIGQTLLIVSVAMVISGVVGLALGVALYATRPGNLYSNRVVFGAIGLLVNIIRPIPFVIFIAAIGPLQQLVVGSTIGTNAVAFAIALAAAFAVARIVEQSLVGVDPGVVEAARAMGASRAAILFGVVVREGLGPLVLGYTFTFVGIVDMSAQAGLVGGGGLGDYAITYGSQTYNWGIVYAALVAIVAIVIVGQFLGNRLARAVMRR
ncbi:D-methionine transport system permease protein [Quadrisphaera granulorum]|uniref:D-methionine transport system permease protein n=1 Tax=Quadrisphaera granulorum TaxID=317664 RepID=A0A315ZSI5_9ACTN|nr:ABC transporter permease subunit [Quadrisphaera granulorum]PWJ47858.1 D-methionine transport system permease protein [Quadrisphaera granulorum]SZE98625.1 D-methionine transport system permease protein [Quadrisphaera granulorum]